MTAWLTWAQINNGFATAWRGDEAAFAALVQEHQQMIRALTYRMTGSMADAEDLAQDTFVRAYRQLDRFRTLLDSAPEVLLTWHRENNGEERTSSPWLARIETFHKMAWQDSLDDCGLEHLVDHPGTRVSGHHPLALPPEQSSPRVTLPSGTLPAHLSVSAHGTLIDCPYRFFAASGLQLKAREEVKLALEKADYGSLVHQALEIFHQGRAGYPPAFRARITQDNQQQAIDQLQAISARVFTHDVEDNYEHRAWARRWQALIPLYIDWQREHKAAWSFAAGEQDAECALSATRSLHGRLDPAGSCSSLRVIRRGHEDRKIRS